MNPVDILIEEHLLVRQFLDNLSIALNKLEKDIRPPREFFDKAVEFAQNFTDKFHHYKEEYVMFTQLRYLKEGGIENQIGFLKQQHKRGRNYIKQISESLDGYAEGNDFDISTILENLAAYISLLKNHIHKEDYNFFQMVKETFPEHVLRSLVELFDKENQKSGGKIFEDSQKLVKEMAALL